MSSFHFSTMGLAPHHQLAAWNGWFEPLFELVPGTSDSAAGFEAEARVWSLGPAALGQVRAPRLHAARRGHNLRRDALDHWNIIVGGVETKLTHGGDAVIIPARTPFVISLGVAIESEREADERLQLYLPRDQFAGLAPILDQTRGRPILGATGQLLADYLRLLYGSVPGLPQGDLARLTAPIQAMVAACIAPSAASQEPAAMQMDITRLEQVRRAIRNRMPSATLNAATLCRDVGMSRSQLYRLLDGEGGVAHYIQRLRLLACHAALSDASDTRSIAAIAEACGFSDPSTFSRAFRRAFQVTPSELRMAAKAGVAPAPVCGQDVGAELPTLRSYLRRL